ncbi:MAG: hypothetical protein IPP71_20250 [Bacteroidetes bacterium]|nr:hypothetical protein [Bacteroidota bacterium]
MVQLGTLPTTSNNNITGTWNPSTISTSSQGTTTYTFTPTAGQCATTATMRVTVNPCDTNIYTTWSLLCRCNSGTLPTTSNNNWHMESCDDKYCFPRNHYLYFYSYRWSLRYYGYYAGSRES